MAFYEYLILGSDQYRVIKRWKEGDKEKRKDYIVSFRNGGMLCDCKWFFYRKRPCKHTKFILSQLKKKGGILRFEEKIDTIERSKNGI